MTAAISRLAEPAAEGRHRSRNENPAAAHHPRPAGQLAAAAANNAHKAFLAEPLTAECDERDARRASG